MTDRLVICVLGKPNSGKSYTWRTLFGDTAKKFLRSGGKELRLRSDGCVDERVEVFLVYSSPEELDKPVGDILGDQKCPIVLCSMQYPNKCDDPYVTLKYFIDRDFFLYAQWLNPGYKQSKIEDQRLVDKILSARSVLSVRKVEDTEDDSGRVQEIQEFIYGWAKLRRCRRAK